MSTHICTHCGHAEALFGEGGGQRLASRYDVPLFGRLPLSLTIREDADRGYPTVAADPQGRLAEQYQEIALRIAARLAQLKINHSAGLPPVVVENKRRKPMTIKSDHWIRRMAEAGMITPFEPRQVRYRGQDKVISYGTSSYGYDVRCANEFKIFTNINSAIVDPKNFDPNSFVEVRTDVCIIPPNSFVLAHTVEYFKIPRNVLTICVGKSTYARCGIIVNVTPLEPEWEGHVTLEFSNTTNLPAKIYANEGVAQMLFFESDEICETSYADRGGKYQGQRGVTLPVA